MSPTWTTTCSRSSPSARPPGTTADLAHIEECERCTDELDVPARRRRPRPVRGRRRRARRARAAGLGPRRRGARAGCARVGLVACAAHRCPVGRGRLVGVVVCRRHRPGRPARLAPTPRRALDRRQPPPSAWWSAAARRGGSPTSADPVTVIATAILEPLPGWDATGSAVVETLSDGRGCSWSTSTRARRPTTGSARSGCSSPTSAGSSAWAPSTGASGRFDLPAGLDLDQFSVVDVSEEQFDGDPAHSGDSIVRGPLEA